MCPTKFREIYNRRHGRGKEDKSARAKGMRESVRDAQRSRNAAMSEAQRRAFAHARGANLRCVKYTFRFVVGCESAKARSHRRRRRRHHPLRERIRDTVRRPNLISRPYIMQNCVSHSLRMHV